MSLVATKVRDSACEHDVITDAVSMKRWQQAHCVACWLARLREVEDKATDRVVGKQVLDLEHIGHVMAHKLRLTIGHDRGA